MKKIYTVLIGLITLILVTLFTLIILYFHGVNIPFISIEPSYLWEIGIGKLSYSNNVFQLQQFDDIKKPVITSTNITDRFVHFVADPFIIREKDKYFMFFEALNNDQNGDIGLSSSTDGKNWKYDKIVLDEKFHLSYPYVFKFENEYYMLPETSAINEIRLYKAVNFPYEWKFFKTLVSQKKYVDSTLLHYNNRWWLFASTGANDVLDLYYSDNLNGNYKPHPNNPIIKNNKSIARGGGNFLEYSGKVFRVTQDCTERYGKTIRLLEITKLTPLEFEENEVSFQSLVHQESDIHTLSTANLNDSEMLAAYDIKKNISKRRIFLGRFVVGSIKN